MGQFFLGYLSDSDGDARFVLIDEDNTAPRAQALLEELQRESDRGAAIVGAALLEDMLSEILIAFSQNSEVMEKHLARAQLSAKADLAHALGVISADERAAIKGIQGIRNKFAHVAHTSFEHKQIRGHCLALEYAEFSGNRKGMSARDRFLSNLFNLLIELADRPDFLRENPLPKIGIQRVLKQI